MKNKFLLAFAGVIGVILIGVVVVLMRPVATKTNEIVPVVSTPNVKNISFMIDGVSVALVNGKFEREVAPGSASKETFSLFGEPVYGDLNGDGNKTDAAMYITRDSGGSGTFYYVVLAVNEGGVYKGTNAMFLGDRIAPQNINIEAGRAVANFAERKTGEPFSVQPSVGKSVWIHLDTKKNEIGEFVKDFEGEANPATMRLDMKQWVWVRTDYADGKKVEPKKADVFGLTFKNDGTVAVKTDCNSMGGTYTAKGESLIFGNMMSTLMFCDGSQEGEFASMVADVSSYSFTGKGELMLNLKNSNGKMMLR